MEEIWKKEIGKKRKEIPHLFIKLTSLLTKVDQTTSLLVTMKEDQRATTRSTLHATELTVKKKSEREVSLEPRKLTDSMSLIVTMRPNMRVASEDTHLKMNLKESTLLEEVSMEERMKLSKKESQANG